MNILQQFFFEHFHTLDSCGISIRDTVYENVHKMLHCGDFNYGFALYGCEHCGNLKAFIYKNCPNGFYVYAKPSLSNNKEVLKYIGRYLGRPVIATSRIDNYDGTNVTFHYNRHEDNILVTKTVSAVDFIKMLIIHIPEKHFKMIRYYGIYAKHHKHEQKLLYAVPKQKKMFPCITTYMENISFAVIWL